MTGFLTLLRLIPVKAWLIAFAIIGLAFWYWRSTEAAYQRGKSEALQQIEKGTRDAEKRADDELRRLDRGDDGRVRQFDRD